MKAYFTSRMIAVVTAGGLLAAFALSGVAQAVTDTIFKYTTPKTGYLAISPVAFAPELSSLQYSVGRSILLAANGTACFEAPVNLPQGAKMTALAIWYRRTAPNSFSVGLNRHPIAPENLVSVVVANPVADTGGVYKPASYNITNASEQTVDNQHNNYFLVVCLSNTNDEFYGARITYSYDSAGD
jgi:hypothetical protein